MRNFFLLLFSTLSFSAFAQFQITGLTAQSNQVSGFYCDSAIAMSFSALTAPLVSSGAEIEQVIQGINFTGFQFSAFVNWGDGVSTTHSGGTGTSGTVINMSPPVVHQYNAAGTYQIFTSIYNPQTQSTVLDTVQITISNCIGNICTNGFIYCDGNNNGVYESGEFVLSNAPVTVTNLENGNIISTATNTAGYYSAGIVGSSGDSISISINSNYLANMGYSASAPIIQTIGLVCQPGTSTILNNIPIQCTNFNPFPYLCYSGYIYCDANGNGVQNVGEMPMTSAPINLGYTAVGGNYVTVYSDSSGYFSYCGSIYGVNSVAIASVSSDWLANNSSTLPNNNNFFSIVGSYTNITQPLSIGVYCAGSVTPCSDLWTTVTPWIGYFQGQNATIRLNWGNYGPGSTPYTLTLTWPANVTLNTWSILNPNYVINGNSITWTINSTQTSFSTTDQLSFTLPSGLINGEQHVFTSTIASSEGTDCYEGNNTGGLLQILGNAYDPNDKNVYRKSYHDDGISGFNASTIIFGEDDVLEYTIRFQNTGTAPAQNVYILDTLAAELDWSTFQLLQATHNINVVNLGNGILRFEFNNIWLPDSSVSQELSQGHLIFRIRETPGNILGSEITNTAYIYFDWNPAIVTNTTYNINDNIEFVGEENAFRVEAFPNPMLNELTLKVEGKFNYEIHDLTGRKLTEGMGVNQTTINTESLATGTYLLSVYVNGAKQTGKVLKY